MNRKILFTVFMTLFLILFIFNIFDLNYNDLSFSENKGTYLGMLSNLLLFIAMIISRRDASKKSK